MRGAQVPQPERDVRRRIIRAAPADRRRRAGDLQRHREVRFTSGATGTYTDAVMTTAHEMTFSGKSGTLYQYYVSSTDAAGNKSPAGPFTHQNQPSARPAVSPATPGTVTPSTHLP